jgi:hypothetical protein
VWSPDSSAVAFQLADGIHIANVPADISQASSCASISDPLVIAGGSQPFWGATDVNPSQAPPPPGGTGAGTPAGGGRPGGGTSCSVPGLLHLTLGQARTALRRGDCSLGTVRRLRHSRARHVARVIRQSVRPHSRHRAGYPVDITLR